MSSTRVKHTLSYEAATQMVAGAIAKAKELGCKQNAAVVDDGGNLLAFGRMDDAPLLGIEGAQRKAYTALLGIGTQTFFERVKDNLGALHGLSHFKRSTMVGGGLPVILDDMIVGGIGVGGGSVEEDIACAQAGIDALRGD